MRFTFSYKRLLLVALVTLVTSAAAMAGTAVSPTSVNFGNVTVGYNGLKTLRVWNNGTNDIKIQSITTSGSTAFSFSGWSAPIILKPSAGFTLNLYFKPTTTGTQYATLTITRANGSYIKVPIQGNGVQSSVTPIALSTSALPNGYVGTAYSTKITATGGTPPYTARLVSGSLPGGLTLASDGTITGTPTAAGQFSFGVEVKDSGSSPQAATGSFTITIINAPKITTTSLPSGTVGTYYSAQLGASGGTSPYTWSITSGSLPASLNLSSSGLIAGTPSAAATSSFTVQATDAAGRTVSASFTITTSNSGTGTSTGKYYGSGLQSDGLTNTALGPNGYVSYRFRATQTSALVSVRLKEQDNAVHTGYAGGTGGSSWILKVQTDDGTSNHYPSGNTIASATLANPMAPGYYKLVNFSSPASLTAGQIYHLVVINGDSNPTVNYTSVDNIYTASPTTPAQPTLQNSDWALLHNTGSGWSYRAGHTPILQLNYASGASAGVGYIDTWSSSAAKTISGSAAVRETFTVTGATRTVSAIAVRVKRLSGSSPLRIKLQDADGTLIEQADVPASAIGTSATWAKITLSSPRTLTSGQGYNLVLTAPSDTSYSTWPMQKGSSGEFSTNTFFPDGFAQFATTGTNWAGWNQSGSSYRTDLDMQFYFTIAP